MQFQGAHAKLKVCMESGHIASWMHVGGEVGSASWAHGSSPSTTIKQGLDIGGPLAYSILVLGPVAFWMQLAGGWVC